MVENCGMYTESTVWVRDISMARLRFSSIFHFQDRFVAVFPIKSRARTHTC